ncbi:thiamine phosphate synthase [Marinomonas flavescens]|uniref:thiamine phosphate synthase n=1 Tax=Marinomonas flavescens TaxID=2529379 RepID=UPI001056D2C9|nr:thiamine phosphate synthase [Marinomonas flavescens]
MNPYQLYLVTDENLTLERLKYVVAEAVKGGVTMVQIREKHHDVRAFIERANAIKTVLQGSGVPLIINDRVDVALAVDADGVHLGQSDMPASLARRLIGPNKLLGLSIESHQQLADVVDLPIDYIGLSAIFATPTKTDTLNHWGISGLRDALQTTSLPIVAIGGINPTNIEDVAATGVHGIALVSAICQAEDPRLASEEIKALL